MGKLTGVRAQLLAGQMVYMDYGRLCGMVEANNCVCGIDYFSGGGTTICLGPLDGL